MAISVLQAGPAESSIIAAMRLSEEPNYTWASTIEDDARTYEIVGKTERGGPTRVRMPLVNALRRQLGRSAPDHLVEAVFLGNERCVLHTESGWLTLDEVRRIRGPVRTASVGTTIRTVPGPGGGSYLINTSPVFGTQRGMLGPRPPERRPVPYSNLQFAVSHPHEELGVVVASHRDWQVEGEVVTGSLSEMGAALLLVRDGQREIQPLAAGGTFKLWIRDGMVIRYQLRLEGVLSVATSRGTQRVAVQQVSFTNITDVGTTQLDVPAEAKRKLEG